MVVAWIATRLLIVLWASRDDVAARSSLFAQLLGSFGGDVRHYYEWSGAWLEGHVPYRDVTIQYPPGAVLLFTIPRLFARTFEGYAVAFALELMTFEALALVLIGRMPALLVGPERGRAAQTGVLAALAYVGLSALLGRLLVRRFDVAVGALVLAFVHCVVSNKRPLWAELVLALGIWIKLTPAALVPLYLVMLHRREPGAAPFGRWLVTSGWRPVVRIGLLVAVLVAPFAWLARGALAQVLRFQAHRGVHLESLPGSLIVLVQSLHGVGLTAREAHGAVEVFHPLVPALKLASNVAAVAALLVVAAVCARRLREARGPVEQNEVFAYGTVATLLSVMGVSRLFSPQYVLWVAALLPLTQLRGVRRSEAVAAAALFALTGYLYLFDYYSLSALDRLPAAMLLIRNLAVLWLVWQLCGRAGRSEPARAPAPGTESSERRARAVGIAIALVVAAWIVVTNVTALHEGELWSDVLVGREILTRHVFPRTDLFTATGGGAPIAFPDWLSGVSFYALLGVAPAWVLCLLQPAVASGCGLLLVLSVRREARRSAALVPLLLLAMNVVSCRTDVRHEMFSPLGVAAVGFALQRWRRSGRLRDVAWLVPMQLVWSNLSGEALAAPLLIGLLAVVVGVAARLGGGTVPDGDRALGQRDALVLGGLAAALFLVTMCNPYGVGRALWSPGWEDGDGQWSLAPAVTAQYPFWSCAALVVALWLALALRWPRRRPVVDVAIAAFATFMSVRASRFLPYAAVLGFPILVHSARDLASVFLTSPAPRRWLGLELGLGVALLAAGAVDGYRFNAWAGRPPGLGVTKQLPFEEVQLVKAAGLEGAIFNDRAVGGFISFSLTPGVRPVIDARPDAQGSRRWEEYRRARSSQAEFLAYLDKYDVRFVLLHVDADNIPMLQTLGGDAGWTLAHDSASYGLYIRKAAP